MGTVRVRLVDQPDRARGSIYIDTDLELSHRDIILLAEYASIEPILPFLSPASIFWVSSGW